MERVKKKKKHNVSTVFRATPGISQGHSAKQELEQFRVNVNPSSYKQLKIILSYEKGDQSGSSESFPFYKAVSCSPTPMNASQFTIQLLLLSILSWSVGSLKKYHSFTLFFQPGNTIPPLTCLVIKTS